MDPGAVLTALLGSANLAEPPAGLRAVRLDRPGEHRRRPGPRRRRHPDQGHDEGARRLDRREPGRRRARSVAGRGAERRRGDPQRRDHRRPAARRHELPELRRPDPARGVLAADRGRPRPRRRVPRARPAGDRRQRLALQRVADRRDRPDARRSASSGCSTTSRPAVGPGWRAAGDRILLVGEATPGLAGSAYAELAGVAAEDGPPSLDLDRERRLQAFVRDAAGPRTARVGPGRVAAAVSPSRSPSARLWARRASAASAPGSGSASRARRPSTCSARARRGSSSRRAAPRARARPARPPARPADRGPRRGRRAARRRRRRPGWSSSSTGRARRARPRIAAAASPTP